MGLLFRESSIRFMLFFIALYFLQGCTVLPSTVRDSAASLPKGKMNIGTDLLPSPRLSFAYGLTNELDIGIDLEISEGLWTKYTLPNQTEDKAVALVAGVFQTPLRTIESRSPTNYSHQEITGYYVGGIYSFMLRPNRKISLAYRYNSLDYDAYRSGSVGGGLLFSASLLAPSTPDYEISDRDLAGIGTLSGTMSVPMNPNLQFHLGASCFILHTNKNRNLDSIACTPAVGFTFFRQ